MKRPEQQQVRNTAGEGWIGQVNVLNQRVNQAVSGLYASISYLSTGEYRNMLVNHPQNEGEEKTGISIDLFLTSEDWQAAPIEVTRIFDDLGLTPDDNIQMQVTTDGKNLNWALHLPESEYTPDKVGIAFSTNRAELLIVSGLVDGELVHATHPGEFHGGYIRGGSYTHPGEYRQGHLLKEVIKNFKGRDVLDLYSYQFTSRSGIYHPSMAAILIAGTSWIGQVVTSRISK